MSLPKCELKTATKTWLKATTRSTCLWIRSYAKIGFRSAAKEAEPEGHRGHSSRGQSPAPSVSATSADAVRLGAEVVAAVRFRAPKPSSSCDE